MKRVVIGWEDRIDDLYSIADDTGATAELCDEEWWNEWKPNKHGKGDDVEVIQIPDDEWQGFVEYANCDDQEE